MPSTTLKHFAKKTGRSLKTAEHDWEKAKSIVRKEYGYSEDDPRFWALTTGITKRMLGMKESLTFKQFLSEKAVGKEPSYSELDVEQAIALLNSKCKNALWMLDMDRPFWRGFKNTIPAASKTGFATVNTAATERASQNTSNFYTVILDNNPLMKDFPKRSRSFIGSSDFGRADDYGWGGGVYAMIPFDNTPIGFVGREDMWDTTIRLFGEAQDIEDYNSMFARLGIKPDIASFKEFSDKLAKGDKDALSKFEDVFDKSGINFKQSSFLDQIFQAYSPAKTGYKTFTTATIPENLKKNDSEVWVGGNVVMMTQTMWKKLRAAWRAGKK